MADVAAGDDDRPRWRFRLGASWLTLPPAVYVLALLVGPIVLIGLYSFNLRTNVPFQPTAFTTAMWKDFLPPGANPFWDLFKSSMVITLTVSAVAVLGAYPV